MKDATFHKGLFTESSMILVEGTYDNGVIYATAFGFPPPESAAVSRSYHSSTNFFGGERGTNIGSSERMQVLERDCENSVCFLSGTDFKLKRLTPPSKGTSLLVVQI